MSVRTHVIVLCQGTQRRLSGIRTPKQLLTLPAHEAMHAPNTKILTRTLMQVFTYLGGVGVNVNPFGPRYNDHHVTVVTWPDVAEYLQDHPVTIPYLRRDAKNWMEFAFAPSISVLPDPGNSSLRGIDRYLSLASVDKSEPYEFDGREISYSPLRSPEWPDRTVVLLGDVVYSWACLRAIFRGCPASSDLAFVGTPQLTHEGGELWGLMWNRSTDNLVQQALAAALKCCGDAEAEEYQPGQLRHWLWALDLNENPLGQYRPWYIPIEDYTVDIDLPEHLVNLAAASLEAVNDDRENGVVW